MKTLIKRGRRAVIREKLKTAVICLLCAGCVYFTYRVIDLQYKPSGAGGNFWSAANPGARNAESALSHENSMSMYLKLAEPDIVMVNRGDNRGILKKDEDGYERTIDLINKAIQGIYSPNTEISKVSRAAVWNGLLKSNSVYIKFPCEIPTAFSARFFQTKDSQAAKTLTACSEALLVPDTASGRVCVFIPGANGSDEVVKFTTETFAATLTEAINGLSYIDKKEFAYAYELNLDKSGSGAQKPGNGTAVLDPMLIIPLEKVYTRPLIGSVPWEYGQGLSFTQTTDFTMRLLNIFQYNPNTIRQYADKDGALMFVSGKGTIGAHPDGRLEYKALDETEGISLSSNTQTKSDDLYASAAGLINVINKIYNLCGIDCVNNISTLKFTNISQIKADSSELNIGLDYYVDGYRVQLPEGHAAEAVIHGGTLVQLKIWIKSFNTVDREYENAPLLGEIDAYCAEGTAGKNIKTGTLYYSFKENGTETDTAWNIQGGQGR